MKTLTAYISTFFLLCLFILSVTSCQSPAKLVQKGKYDKAIDSVLKDVRKGKSINTELRHALEDAFSSTTARNMSYIESMKNNPRVDNWELVYDRALAQEALQSKIEMYLPIYDELNTKANFNFVKTQVIMDLAATKATERYYEYAQYEIAAGRTGNIEAARQAHKYLERLARFNPQYKDAISLKREAKELGTVHILVEIENRTFGYVPLILKDRIEDRLMASVSGLPWTQYHANRSNRNYHYSIAYLIDDFNVSPDIYRETVFNETKLISEIYYKTDDNGAFVLDQEGRRIELTRDIEVRARVVKVLQSKEARLAGELVLRDLRNNAIINDRPIIIERAFLKESCSFSGDERALADNVPNLGPPVQFPRDEDLVRDAVNELEDVFRTEIAGISFI